MYRRQFTHLDGHNAYDVLGVDEDATRAQIEAARRRLAGRVHPDLPTGDAAAMSLVNAAASILLDDDQRDAYDEFLATPPRAAARPLPRAGASSARRVETTVTRRAAPQQADRPMPGRVRPRPSQAPQTGYGPRPSPRPRPGHGGRRSKTWDDDTWDDDTWDDEAHRQRPAARRRTERDAAGTGTRESWWESAWLGAGGSGQSTRPPLRWQPPPPGALARWRAERRARHLARGEQPGRAHNPLIVLGLFLALVAGCALSGAFLGYRANFGGSTAGPRPEPSVSQPVHPRSTPSAHPRQTPTSRR
jgi:curved DNA-binding protein CbpA